MLENKLIKPANLIGKSVCFQNGYVIVRYNYSKFINYVDKLNTGNFVLISSVVQDRILVGQIVDIYDADSNQEENIRSSIANNGDITSLERDIYLFIEVKIKLLFAIEGNKFVFDNFGVTSRLKNVYLLSKDCKKYIFENIFNFEGVNSKDVSFENNQKILISLSDDIQVKVRGLIFAIGNVLNKIDSFKNVKSIGYKEFISNKELFLKASSDHGTVVVKINNRLELIKLSNSYVKPDFVIGENLIKEDYQILKRMIILKSDYIPYNGLYLIYNGVIFT
ncbi:MAG: hypothetical protein ACK4GJ_01430 [bacterium]